MLAGDLKALDRTLKVIESQDRYRGFGHPGGAATVANADAERARDKGLWKLVTVQYRYVFTRRACILCLQAKK
jgi:hypothetical protein